MANVNIKFNGKDYLLSCDDGQEENLKELANHLNKKFNELKSNLGNIGENKLLLISSIKVIDEYYDLVKKVESKKKELQKKYINLNNEHQNLKHKLEKINLEAMKKFENQNKFTQKVDELNQETDSLIEEIDKWQT